MTSFAHKKRIVLVRYQWQLFCLALMFFTRLPVSKTLPYSDKRMNQANRYFSAVGLVVGGIVAASLILFNQLFPSEISVVLALALSVLLTGAFHEDGLADMADGIGGGLTVDKRLTIMKDSRIGTYGTVTLILSFLLKFYLLVALINSPQLALVIVFAYSMSRACAASLIVDTPYVADLDKSKSKPLAVKQQPKDLMVLISLSVVPLLVICTMVQNAPTLVFTLLATLWIFRVIFRRWLISRLGGYTGDCLGASQQVSEILIYLVMVNHFQVLGGLA